MRTNFDVFKSERSIGIQPIDEAWPNDRIPTHTIERRNRMLTIERMSDGRKETYDANPAVSMHDAIRYFEWEANQ